MTLYVLNYNNYYNRIVKKYNTVQEYLDNVEVIYTLEDTNFNPNDNVNTTHTFGWSLSTDNYEGDGNYLLIVDKEENIVSRWFILDSVRDTGGQWTCSLHRDVIADNYETVINAPCFIEKGLLNAGSNFIFNNENMSYNQIKTAEYPLMDSTQTPWIVGYTARNTADTTINYEISGNFDYSSISLEDFEGYKYQEDSVNSPKRYIGSLKYVVNYDEVWSEEGNKVRIYGQNGDYLYSDDNLITTGTSFLVGNAANYHISELDAIVRNYLGSIPINKYFKSTDLGDIKKYANKILRTGNESDGYRYYQITLKSKLVNNKLETLTYNNASEFYEAVAEWRALSWDDSFGDGFGPRKGLHGYNTIDYYWLEYTEVPERASGITYTTSIKANKNKLEEVPYDMFCMPLKAITLGSTTYNSDEISILIAQSIYSTLSSACYDIQLLPYCPLGNIDSLITYGIEGLALQEGPDFEYIKDNDNNVVSIIFYPKTSSFSRIIPINLELPSDRIEFKVAAECDKYRLCSPNYNGVFEFSLAKNGGLNYVEVNATYKPYNPYIHLNPNFGRLYGSDFNDARGLILGGDFSMAAVSDAWANYELQNKNYQKVFDRQIQNMEFNNNIARLQESANMITGTVQAGAQGAAAGGMAGGPWGAAAGMLIGSSLSLVGGGIDYSLNQSIRAETLDYTKDLFGYQLGNIKALPYSLSKSSAFDINTKQFPFIEYYTCSDEEKDALRNKIKYNGMTVMKIDKIKNFIYNEESYIKGKLIRIEDFNEDYHIINTISEEINKGFFIKEDTN